MDKSKVRNSNMKIDSKSKIQIKKMFLIFGFCIFSLFCNLCFVNFNINKCFANEKIIAFVNDEIITQKDLDDFMGYMRMQMQSEFSAQEVNKKVDAMKADLLDRLIEDRLIMQEAKKENIKVDENRIKAKISELKKHYPSESDFQDSLKAQGLVQADLEQKAREQMMMYSLIENKVRSKILVSPNEVTEYYQKNSEQFMSPQEWEFQSMVLEDYSKANDVIAGIKKGQSANDFASSLSGGINKLKVRKGQLRKEFEDTLLKLKPQEISQPIFIDGKYFVFLLDSINPPRKLSLSEAQNDVYAALYNQKTQVEMAKWLDELKKRSYIKNNQN